MLVLQGNGNGKLLIQVWGESFQWIHTNWKCNSMSLHRHASLEQSDREVRKLTNIPQPQLYSNVITEIKYFTWVNLYFGARMFVNVHCKLQVSIQLVTQSLTTSGRRDHLHRPWAYFNIIMTSSSGNIFRVTGPLCGEFTGDWWIPCTKTSDAELWWFLSSAPDQTTE